MESQGLWCQILMDKYCLDEFGWKISVPSQKASGMWKSIMSVKSEFDNCVQ